MNYWSGHWIRDDLGSLRPKPKRLPDPAQQDILNEVRVRGAARTELPRLQKLLKKHHYLGSLKPVGERLFYIATDASDRWLGILVFSAAANHLRHRDRWIGWSSEQLRRRRSLITNNCRFLLLPECSVPNLGSRIIRLTLDRLSADWQEHYGHPIVVVETCVDPEPFCGTVYTANGWIELGQTDGWGRCQRDYYVKHDKPKRLLVRELRRHARRSLQAEHLKPDLAVVEARVPARCPQRAKEICSIVEHFKKLPERRLQNSRLGQRNGDTGRDFLRKNSCVPIPVSPLFRLLPSPPEYRDRIESYPWFSLATLVL